MTISNCACLWLTMAAGTIVPGWLGWTFPNTQFSIAAEAEQAEATDDLPDVVDYETLPSEMWHMRPRVREALEHRDAE